ncbi:MAG: hypothetical protein AAFN10_20985 [Bacteroidota bacterium]
MKRLALSSLLTLSLFSLSAQIKPASEPEFTELPVYEISETAAVVS